ncbi:stalk domain-containing protein [Paenibacillus thiaminolyticus]|uniref:copper amine oxidase n=1 Tax=Paenibacillus thiaminolyticus TaxID=49283 RepID=UPI003D2A966B
MKKCTYLLSGVIIGAIVATAGTALADEVKTLIGKKVTGEYTVLVNGKELQDKGAVIDGRTNVPVRGISNALGVDMKVEGKKIIITSDDTGSVSEPEPTNSNNPYIGKSKADLEKSRDSLQNETLANFEKGRKKLIKEIEDMERMGAPRGEGTSLTATEDQLAEYDAEIAKYTKELELINEALAAQK